MFVESVIYTRTEILQREWQERENLTYGLATIRPSVALLRTRRSPTRSTSTFNVQRLFRWRCNSVVACVDVHPAIKVDGRWAILHF